MHAQQVFVADSRATAALIISLVNRLEQAYEVPPASEEAEAWCSDADLLCRRYPYNQSLHRDVSILKAFVHNPQANFDEDGDDIKTSLWLQEVYGGKLHLVRKLEDLTDISVEMDAMSVEYYCNELKYGLRALDDEQADFVISQQQQGIGTRNDWRVWGFNGYMEVIELVSA